MKVVDLVHTSFWEVRLAEEATWQAVVLISKVGGKFRVISIVEVLWKTVAMILNRLLGKSITLHGVLNGFWGGCGTVNASPEAKLLEQLTAIQEEVLYTIFLNLHKAHDALYRYRFIGILE